MNDTTIWRDPGTAMRIADLQSTSVTDPHAPVDCGRLSSRLPQLAMAAFLVITAPITYFDPAGDLRRSGAATRLVEMQPRRRRFVTMAMARQISLQALKDARRERTEERLEEARLNDLRWNDEDFS